MNARTAKALTRIDFIILPLLIGLTASKVLYNFAETVIVPSKIEIPELSTNSQKEIKLQDDEYVKLITERNVFNSKITNLNPTVEADDVGSYALKGTVITSKYKYALLDNNGKTILISTSSVNHDCIALDVERESAKIKCQERVFDLKLEKRDTSTGGSNTAQSSTQQQSASSAPTTNHITISRQEIQSSLGNINQIFTTVNVVPMYQGDNFIGYRINAMSSKSPLIKLGLATGDVIRNINGQSTEDPSALYGLLGQLSDMDSISLGVNRHGQDQEVLIDIK